MEGSSPETRLELRAEAALQRKFGKSARGGPLTWAGRGGSAPEGEARGMRQRGAGRKSRGRPGSSRWPGQQLLQEEGDQPPGKGALAHLENVGTALRSAQPHQLPAQSPRHDSSKQTRSDMFHGLVSRGPTQRPVPRPRGGPRGRAPATETIRAKGWLPGTRVCQHVSAATHGVGAFRNGKLHGAEQIKKLRWREQLGGSVG